LREYTLPNSQVWAAKTGGEIISFVVLGQNFIDQLYVRESFQNKGLGGFWIKHVKTIYPDFLELYTFASNEKAIAFYEKHGFKITERGIAPDEKMPDVKMRWESAAARRYKKILNVIYVMIHGTILLFRKISHLLKNFLYSD
jgi:GNAT superfamily N-acetyltransferase